MLVVVRPVRGVAVLAMHEIVVVIMRDALVAALAEMHVHMGLMRQMLVALAPTMVRAVPDLWVSLRVVHRGDGTRWPSMGAATRRRVKRSRSARVGHDVHAGAQGHR